MSSLASYLLHDVVDPHVPKQENEMPLAKAFRYRKSFIPGGTIRININS